MTIDDSLDFTSMPNENQAHRVELSWNKSHRCSLTSNTLSDSNGMSVIDHE